MATRSVESMVKRRTAEKAEVNEKKKVDGFLGNNNNKKKKEVLKVK